VTAVSPNTAEGDGVAIDASDGKRRLPIWIVAPLVVDRRGDEAAPSGERLLEHAGRGDALRPGIDRLTRLPKVLGEKGDQAPLQRVEMTLALTRQPDN
jgi:hypothetical protein